MNQQMGWGQTVDDTCKTEQFRRIVAFYIPLRSPLAISPNQAFHCRRDEPVDWIEAAPWPDRFEALRDILRERNFVTFRLSQSIGKPRIDLSPLNAAMATAIQETTGQRVNLSYIESQSAAFDGTHDSITSTVVEAMTVLIPTTNENLDHSISDAFDRVLEELRSLETAYDITQKRPGSFSTNRVNLFPFAPYALFDPFSSSWSPVGLFGINDGSSIFLPSDSVLSGEEISAMTIRWGQLRRSNPLLDYVKASFAAGSLLNYYGNFAMGSVQIYTAGEILLNTLLLLLAWEEIEHWENSSLTREEVYDWFSKRSTLETRLRNHYQGRLKGWNTEDRSKPLYWWLNEVSLLRNRIVHAGFEPTEAEARRSREILWNLETYVKDDLLVSDRNRCRYPRATLMFVSREGLIRRGKYIGQIKRLDEESLHLDWVGGFIAFRDWLNDEILSRKGEPRF